MSWQPMQRARPVDPDTFFLFSGPAAQMWMNDGYTAIERPAPEEYAPAGWTWLSLRRNDREPVTDWRDVQRIKNDVCGPEREAIELYPAESRVVDGANQFHLWVLPEGVRVGIGFPTGARLDESDPVVQKLRAAGVGGRQRPLEAE